MGSVLYVVPDRELNGPARQVSMLASRLTREGWAIHIATVSGGWFDLRPLVSLRSLVKRERPDIVHAWCPVGARLAALAMFPRGQFVVSDVGSGQLSWGERWWMQRAIHAQIPPMVEVPPAVDRASLLRELNLAADARLIVCSGAIERGRGFREAVWVFDILKYVYPELWLLVLGDGPERMAVEQFGRSLGRDDFRVRFAGCRADAAALLGLAEVVWVLGNRGGRQVMLEALAAGRPVVARHRPDLLEWLGDHEAGFLVPRADRHEVARATRRLLDDAPLHDACSKAARRRAELHVPEQIMPLWHNFYATLMKST